ncbi:hypothetical protein ACHQM5_005466 [Ranunculus cassubicifolius]
MARTKHSFRRAAKRCRPEVCSSDDEQSNDKPFPSRDTPSSCIRIFNALSLDNAKEKNFVFSPCSIHLAMSLLANGSSGSTLKEFLDFCEAETLDDLNSVATELVTALMASTKKGPKLSFVSGLWVDQSLSLNPNFETVAESIYKGKAKAVDFKNNAQEVVDEVNEWAKSATNGLIDSLVPKDFFQGTQLALANAVYFKAKWPKERGFLKDDTRDSTFYLFNGDSVEVPFMWSGKDRFIKVLGDSKVLRIPYRKSVGSKQNLAMHIILPNERDGLMHLVEKLSSDLSLLKKYLGNNKKEVKVRNLKIPKFKITFEVEASDILKRVGLELPFSNKAEFSELVQEDNLLQVTGVQHKSYIDVNEEGTEAAASTVCSLGSTGGMAMPVRIDFLANHPFMFVIREEKSEVVSDEVNEWARAATNGLIDSLVSENSFGQETKLALANALYFKAKWQKEKKFLKNYTRDSTFYLLNGDSVEKEVKVENFKIPKFKIAFDVEASDILKRVGLELPFSNKAEFNELVQKLEFGNSLQVSGVQHKSYIEVNEEGTEAAASTVVHLAAGCSMIKPVRIDFVADHPFMFLIREEKSGVVLFMGHVVNPLLQ